MMENPKNLARMHRNARNEEFVAAYKGLRALRLLEKNEQRMVREWANAGEINMEQLENLLAQYESQLLTAYERHARDRAGI